MRRPATCSVAWRGGIALALAGAICVGGIGAAAGNQEKRSKRLLRRTPALEALAAAGRLRVLDEYGARSREPALLVTGDASSLQAAQEASGESWVRGVADEVLLRSRTIDTSGGSAGLDAGRSGRRPGLEIVQFHGPVKAEWLARLRGEGRARPIAYLPHNAYLVWIEDPGTLEAAGLPIQWRGPFSGADRLSPDLPPTGDTVSVTVQVARAGDHDGAIDAVRARALAVTMDPRSTDRVTDIRVVLPVTALGEIAGIPEVVWIEPFSPPVTHDEKTALITAGLIAGNLPAEPGYMGWLKAQGLGDLSSVIVDITDTGIGRGTLAPTHPGLQGRLAYALDATAEGSLEDCPGHGTNMAGIIAGAAGPGSALIDPEGYLAGLGVAPSVRIGSTRIFSCDNRFAPGLSFSAIVADAWARGARIGNNSWGGGGAVYNTVAAEYDALVRDANRDPGDGDQGFLPVFSAGNSGPRPYSVGWPATAKNVLSVGATEGLRPGVSDGCGVTGVFADNVHHILNLTGRGPTGDGRLKPDLVAPGSHIISLASDALGYTGAGVCDPYYPPGQRLLNWATGTSQAAAHASGAAAIAYAVYRRERGTEPSPAMLKAMLINHAHDLGGTPSVPSNTSFRPNMAQGWGRIDVGDLVEARARVAIDQTVLLRATGETAEFGPVVVEDPTKPIVITLAWTDAPGSPAGWSWVNDLDLEVEAGGKSYLGNVIDSGVSVPGGTPDFRNNVENVILPPGNETIAVRVRAANIAGDGVPSAPGDTDQDFALYIGNARLPSSEGTISIDGGVAVCGSDATVRLSDRSLRGLGRFTAAIESGADRENIILEETPPASGVFAGPIDVLEAPPAPGNGSLEVSHAQPVTARYLQADPGGGSPIGRSATATAICDPPLITDISVARSGSFEATVRWTTDRPADSEIRYGAGSGSDFSKTDARLVTDHAVRLSSLPSCALITATVASTDAAGLRSEGPSTPLRFSSGQGTGLRRILFRDDMEALSTPWEHHPVSNGAPDAWELGFTTSGPPGPFSGIRSWGTNLDGNYPAGHDAVLVSPPIDLSDAVGAELTFWHYYSITGGRPPISLNDGGWVEISGDGGATWTVIDPLGGYPDTIDEDNPWIPDASGVYAGAVSGWVKATFDLRAFGGSVVRIRFHLWQDSGEVNPTSAGWFIDDVQVTAEATCHTARIALDAEAYGCSSQAVVTVHDTDLNRSATLAETATVLGVGPAGEVTLSLTETGVNTGQFRGPLALSPAPAPGSLAVSEGDSFTVSHVDQDTGDGTPATVTAAALVPDCTPPPAPQGVVALPSGPGRLQVSWSPVGPPAAPDLQGYRIFYDSDGPGPVYSGSGAVQGSSPVRVEAVSEAGLSSLTACEPYFITVTAFDRLGNESPFSQETIGVPESSSPCALGRMVLAPPAPGCSESITVSVSDGNADPDLSSPGSIEVTAVSGSLGGALPVNLIETGPASGTFTGTAPLAASAVAGRLTVTAGDVVTVEYLDADDGIGGARVVSRSLPVGDCAAPVITDVRVTSPGSDRAIIAWETDEPSDSVVVYGPDPSLGLTATIADLTTQHRVPISGLAPCSPVYFGVTSSDAHQNAATATDGGVPFRFGTSRDVTLYLEDFESGAPGWTHATFSTAPDEWEVGPPLGDGLKAPSSAWSGTRVAGTDLDGPYERVADAVLVSPPINLGQGDAATLVFRHWYDITSVGAPQGFDDGGFVEISTDGGSSWRHIEPAPTGYPDIVTVNPYTAFGAGAYAGSTGGWIQAAFLLDAYAGQTVRFRFHLYQDKDDHNVTGQGWYLDDVEVRTSLACHAGRVEMDESEYGCGGSSVGLRVFDADPDVDPTGPDSVLVTLSSDMEPGGEPLLLWESGPSTGVFEGSMTVSSVDAPGTLHVRDSDTIIAVYIDADDGTGASRAESATARVTDCTPPVISNVAVVDRRPDSLRVTWSTSEPSDGTVLFGPDPGYGGSAGSAALTTNHDVVVSGLPQCTIQYLTVVSADALGNTTRDDIANGPLTAATLSPIVILAEDFESGAPEWRHEGQGDTWEIGSPAQASPPSGTAIAATSLDGDYPRSSGADNASFILESPPFSLEGVSAPRLTFSHRHDFATGFDGGDGGWVEAWDGESWLRLAPLGGYPGLIDREGSADNAPFPGYSGTSPPGFTPATFDLSGVPGGGSRVTRIRFRVFIESGVGPAGTGWWIDDVSVGGTVACREGRLAFERDPLPCGTASVDLTLHDNDLDTDPATRQSTTLNVASTGGPAPLAITLTETAAAGGTFRGVVPLGTGAGRLRAEAGDVLTATYEDADDGTGTPRTIASSLTVAGCSGPVIGNVIVAPVGARDLMVRWSTDRPSTTNVTLVPVSGGASRSAADFRHVTSHAVVLHDLEPCEAYTATITSRDAAGVESVLTGPGQGLLAETLDRRILFFDDMEGPDPGWTTSGVRIEWERGQPATGPPSAFSGTQVLATDLTGTYDGGTNATLISPPIDLTHVAEARMSFWHWYDIFASDPPNSTDDSAWVEVQVPGATFPTYVTPIGGYPDITDAEGGDPMPEGTPVYAGQTTDWERAVFDLTPFAGKVVTVRFRIWNDLVELLLNGITGSGWYLDDVEITSPSYCHAEPTLIEVTAPPLTQGSTVTDVVLTGSGFRAGATVSLGIGLAATAVQVVSPTSIRVDIAVDPRARPGGRDVTVSNPDGQVAGLAGAVEVVLAPGRADINGSGRVDGADLFLLARSFGATEGTPRYDPRADINGDGFVDGTDLALLAAPFGTNVP